MSGEHKNRDENLRAQYKQITYQEIATKLLNDKLLLTALELYTELIEAGKDLHVLRDYFSNPTHFEQIQEAPLISRSGSQVTLDSLDLTRFSEDGERSTDERVAILEFELRKAKETISALRNNLTVATESETNTPDKKSSGLISGSGIMPHEQRALNYLINEYLLLNGYKLTSITFADENENQDFEDWDDVGLNIAKPAELLSLYRDGLKHIASNSVYNSTQTDDATSNDILAIEIDTLNLKIDELNKEINYLQDENKKISQSRDQTLSICSSNGNSPEHFEMIDSNTVPDKKLDNLVLADDNISNNSLNEADWTNVTLNVASEKIIPKDDTKKEYLAKSDYCHSNSRQLPERFKRNLLLLCLPVTTVAAEKQIFENVTSQSLIHVLSQSLLQIIPNIILNKREEVIPLLVNSVYLNPNTNERDKLLQLLFNLKKKPSREEREIILAGIISIARYSGENIVENEILPQCWEQLTHKHVERRLLVLESCIALIPYVSSPIRNSLMLSMLQQMLEDREEVVRQMVVRALSFVVALCDDVDKYCQCEALALRTINDSSDMVVNISLEILFPVIAQWALSIDRLHTDLIKQLLYMLNKNIKDSQIEPQNNVETIIRIITILNRLLPFVVLYVANIEKIIDNIEKDMTIDLRLDILKLCTDLTNPSNFYGGNFNVGMIFYEFDKYIADHPSDTWSQLDWFIDIVLPDLINNLNHVEVTQHVVLQSIMEFQLNISTIFGQNFTTMKIYPLYQCHIQNLEQILSSFNQYLPNLSIIPVYLVSVLSCGSNLEELSNILKRFICALPLCGTPLGCLEITVQGLCRRNLQDLVVNCLWEGVVHQRPLVRASAAGLLTKIIVFCNENLLISKVSPALVTLANDSDVLVRTATVPALGNLIKDCAVPEVHDKVYMQLQACLSDPTTLDNHTLLRQLVVTLGNIVSYCKTSFRDEVIVTQLSSLSVFTSQMSNQTRKVDMALALLEAFPNIIFSPLNKHIISTTLLPGLRCLEAVVMENSSLLPHKDSIISMLRETENRLNISSPQSSMSRSSSSTLSHNVNLGVEDMKQRVSKIFQIPNSNKQSTLPNLQGIFKKK